MLILFLLFTPNVLIRGAQQSFTDTRFVRDETAYHGTITMYHIVRHRPYLGSLSNWLQKRADEYEKKHRGSYIVVQGMDEATFYERLEHGRRADVYSFFSGSLYSDLLQPLTSLHTPLREGLFETMYCVPYCYSGYVRLDKNPNELDDKTYFANSILAACLNGEENASEETADTLYLDMRRAGDLIRYKSGFASAELTPIDNFTDAICWIGIDRDTDEVKASVIQSFLQWILAEEQQQKLSSYGLLSVRSDVKDAAPEASLKPILKTLATVQTVDPFLWYAEYDTLCEDALLSVNGDENAKDRFQKRLRELIR